VVYVKNYEGFPKEIGGIKVKQGSIVKRKIHVKTYKIWVKLLGIILGILILSLGIVAGCSFYYSNLFLKKSVDETALALGAHYADRTQGTVNDLVIQLQDLAAVTELRNPSDKAKVGATLGEWLERMGKFTILNFVFPDGSAVRSDSLPGFLGDRDYFKQVVKTQKLTISQPLIAKTTGKMSIVIGVPVINNEKLVGVLTGTFSLEKFNDYMQEIKFKESGYGFVADQQGTVIAHGKNPNLIGKLNIAEKMINPDVAQSAKELDDRLIRLFTSTVGNNNQIKGIYTFIDNITSVAVATPIVLPDGQRWILLVVAPEAEATSELTQLGRSLFLVCLGWLVVVAVMIALISKRFTKPIVKMRDEVLLLSEGDLRNRSFDLQSNDEIGQLVNALRIMAENLRNLICNVQVQAEHVNLSSHELSEISRQSADASTQIAESIYEIASGSEQQAVAVQTMATVVENISENIEQIAELAQKISATASHTSHEADDGCSNVENAMKQMREIGQKSNETQGIIGELAKDSHEINEIVNLIVSIAEQTNLLALNAAIEAARAGQYGAGFAVVADEVRKLAGESNRAAIQIGSLLVKNEEGMRKATAAAKASSDSVKTGVDLVTGARDTFLRIAASIEELSLQINKIATSIGQVTQGSQKIVSSVKNIEKISTENSSEAQMVSAATEEQTASIEQMTATSQGLSGLSGELQTAIEKFRLK
jgi:methyl-accepting chemotaxis protein